MTDHTNNTWHILGAGAIGCLWACHLQGSGRPVHLLLSPRHATPSDGTMKLHLQTPDGLQKSVTVTASTAKDLDSPVNNLVVSTKATQVLEALHSVGHQFVPDARIVLLLNGMGFQRVITETFSNCKVFAGVTTDGAWLRRPFDVVQAGRGETTLGMLGATANAKDLSVFLHDVQNPGLSVKTTAEIEKALLEKVMINAAINGLTAIHGCPNGELLEIPAAHAQLQQLIEELQNVLLASNENEMASQLPLAVERVITQTAANFSSTYQDVEHGRQTEIEFINGYVCKLGAELGVDTPRNHEIVVAIGTLEC